MRMRMSKSGTGRVLTAGMPWAIRNLRFPTVIGILALPAVIAACSPTNAPLAQVPPKTKASTPDVAPLPAPSSAAPNQAGTALAPAGSGALARDNAGAQPMASQAPTPPPGLAQVLQGTVSIDAAQLLANKFAEPAGTGVRLIGEHGAGLISDNGYGVIGNSLVSNNGSQIVGKVKFTVADVAATSGAAAHPHDLVPVQGMLVSAISLLDGSVLAGPVATDASGHYHLGFASAPKGNMRIVAAVHNLESDPAYSYDTLVAPSATMVVTSDTTRAVASYLVEVLAARLQHPIDDRIAGRTVSLSASDAASVTTDTDFVNRFNTALAKADPALVAYLDKDGTDQPGTFARNFARRVLGHVSLDDPNIVDLAQLTEKLRAYSAGLSTPPEPPLIDQIVKLASYGPDAKGIPPLLQRYGMSASDAATTFDRLQKDGIAITVLTAAAAAENYQEALGPTFASLPSGLIGGSP